MPHNRTDDNMATSKQITFNVGGEKFQLSRSLLDMYPNTVLGKSASKRWLEDPESEVFMDRDPILFRHVLSYLRDKKVSLPITVTKKAVLEELAYYCVDDVDEESIDDSLTQGYLAAEGLVGMIRMIKTLDEKYQERYQDDIGKLNSLIVAKQCIEKCLSHRGTEMRLKLTHDSFHGLLGSTKIFDIKKCSKHLEKVGLQMTWPDRNVSTFFVSRKEVSDKE